MDKDQIVVVPCVMGKKEHFDVVIWGVDEPHDETCYASEAEARAKAKDLGEWHE